MNSEYLVELLTTPKAESKGTLVEKLVLDIKRSSDLMNNAIENDKVLIAGREAHKIKESADLLAELLK